MKIFLNSQGFISVRKHGEKIAIIIDDKNSFLNNIKDSINSYGLFVFVCNDPQDFERNDKNAFFLNEAFKRQLNEFKEVVVLDNRNVKIAKGYLQKADFVYLCGGKIEYQKNFLKEIEFKNNLNKNCVVVGVSAGAMNLCEVAYNYPEDLSELDNEKWINGLGYFNKIIIPHFKRFKGNMYHPKHYNLLKKHYLPDSFNHKLLGLPNGSYILVDEGVSTLYGKSYSIENGKVKKICDNRECLSL